MQLSFRAQNCLLDSTTGFRFRVRFGPLRQMLVAQGSAKAHEGTDHHHSAASRVCYCALWLRDCLWSVRAFAMACGHLQSGWWELAVFRSDGDTSNSARRNYPLWSLRHWTSFQKVAWQMPDFLALFAQFPSCGSPGWDLLACRLHGSASDSCACAKA